MAEKKGPSEERIGFLPEKLFELLSKSEGGSNVTVRDDQNDFSAFLDAAKVCRGKGGRFRLIDSGRLTRFELEWLGKAGADIYTSDEARPKPTEIDFLARTCRRGGAIVAYFHYGPLARSGGEEPASLALLLDICRSGAFVHLSGRERERDLVDLGELAYACREAGSWLVYYHHGRIEPGLAELLDSDAWVHLTDGSLKTQDEARLLLEIVRRRRGKGCRLILHIEEGLELQTLHDFLEAGAALLIKTLPSDYKSAFRRMESQARKKKLDWRAYYLYTDFLP